MPYTPLIKVDVSERIVQIIKIWCPTYNLIRAESGHFSAYRNLPTNLTRKFIAVATSVVVEIEVLMGQIVPSIHLTLTSSQKKLNQKIIQNKNANI